MSDLQVKIIHWCIRAALASVLLSVILNCAASLVRLVR